MKRLLVLMSLASLLGGAVASAQVPRTALAEICSATW
jgi:hypothetical protein